MSWLTNWFVDLAVSFGDGKVPTIWGVTMGGIAFAIFGCRSVLSFNDDKGGGPKWLAVLLLRLKHSLSLDVNEVKVVKWVILIITAVLCGISLFSFGGGIIRDALILKVTPWFMNEESRHEVVIITAIILVYVFIHMYIKKKECKKLREFCYFFLVLFDVYGLFEFAQMGQRAAARIMGDTGYIYILICGLSTQIGGGLIASVIRWDLLSTVRQNVGYYGLALAINISLFICCLTDNTSLFPLVLFLSIVIGLLLNETTSEIMRLIMISIMRNIVKSATILALIVQTQRHRFHLKQVR